MAVMEKLASLGFEEAAEAGVSRGVKTYRIRTSNGWVYQRFVTDDDVQEWSKYHKPEAST